MQGLPETVTVITQQAAAIGGVQSQDGVGHHTSRQRSARQRNCPTDTHTRSAARHKNPTRNVNESCLGHWQSSGRGAPPCHALQPGKAAQLCGGSALTDLQLHGLQEVALLALDGLAVNLDLLAGGEGEDVLDALHEQLLVKLAVCGAGGSFVQRNAGKAGAAAAAGTHDMAERVGGVCTGQQQHGDSVCAMYR